MHEVRFVVDRRTARAVQDWARACLLPDPHGSGDTEDEYHVLTIYFDTPSRDAYHRRGSAARIGYRLRRYGRSEQVYVERRVQHGDVVMKRRVTIPTDTIRCVHDIPFEPDWPGAWFARRLAVRALGPVCQVACRRTARLAITTDLGPDTGRARLTIDESLRATPARTTRFRCDAGSPLLPGHAILTVQFERQLPPLFRQTITRFRLVPATISRYRLGVAALDLSSVVQPDASSAVYTLLTS
jgi:hypothetical protein